MSEPTTPVDLEWLDSNFPCMSACPVHTDAGRYVDCIEKGEFREAYRIARRPNPFASICGRVCAAPCETACRRGRLDEAIAIRSLKRFVCERFGVESMVDLAKLREVFGNTLKRNGIRVAVIGAGPAGLSCAHDLALLGYEVTVFEAQPVAGGMLRLGIPEYRLPRELIRLEINAILSLGVELKLNTVAGRDFTLGDLQRDGYQAIFIGIGAHKSRALNIEGADADGVLRAVDFLLNINLGYRVELGARVIVIGGGNVAIDAARSAARQESAATEHATDVAEALDVARSAVRFGAREVHMVCLEDWTEMPATREEISDAVEERIRIHTRKGPKRIIVKEGKVAGLETIDCVSVFDASGSFHPAFSEGTESILEADTIIMAIGQSSDLSWLRPEDGVEVTQRNTIRIDPETLATSAPGIFAGGDVCFGPRIAIEAIGNGKKAAQSIHRHLSGEATGAVDVLLEDRRVEIAVSRTQDYRRPWGYERQSRVRVPSIPIDRRIGIAQIELGYTEAQARLESSRCLHCWENTVFNEAGDDSGSACIMCGGCVDICPHDCIELVTFDRVELDEAQEAECISRYALDSPGDGETFIGAVMIKDEDLCIRCGLCAMRCPVGCITMQGYAISPLAEIA